MNPVEQLQINGVVGGIIGTVTTILRLILRRRRLWWDDACAFLSMLNLVLHVASIFVDIDAKILLPIRIAAYYLMATTFYTVIWFARLSLLFSIIRIDPDPRQRKKLLFIAGIFVLAGILLISQLFWVCAPDPTWRKASIPQCPLDKQIVVCQLVTDVLSDSILVLAPIKLFRDILDKTLRRRLVFIFSASIMTTVVSLVHAVYVLTGKSINNLISANAETCVSLVVCNLPVFAVATMRLREERTKNGSELETSFDETIISMQSRGN